MEEQCILDIDNELHLFCLHYIYLSRIGTALSQFMEAWNNHPLSTCHNMSPIQLWIQGLSENYNEGISEVRVKHY